jgi:hypothetical protein
MTTKSTTPSLPSNDADYPLSDRHVQPLPYFDAPPPMTLSGFLSLAIRLPEQGPNPNAGDGTAPKPDHNFPF